jgi:hypothetical protein
VRRLSLIPERAHITAPTGSGAPRRRSVQGDIVMGKYLVGWLLGVPVIVLVILYFFFH